MATLPSGAPYMEGTDAANTIDTYTLSNANYWDARTPLGYQSGTGSIAVGAGASGTQAITFASAFPSGATVQVMLTITSSHSTTIVVSTTTTSNTGFTWRAYAGAASTVTVNWIAFRTA